jgi:hypothetical protein
MSVAPAAAKAPSFAPTPFTAEQIRDATQKGRSYRWRVEVPGKPTVMRVSTFTKVEAAGAEATTVVEDEAGHTLDAGKEIHVTWEELRKHAEFPRERVAITDETVTIPAGRFACVVYTVTDADKDEVSKFYFPKEMPGAPVVFFTDVHGARAKTTTLIAYRGSDAAPRP